MYICRKLYFNVRYYKLFYKQYKYKQCKVTQKKHRILMIKELNHFFKFFIGYSLDLSCASMYTRRKL